MGRWSQYDEDAYRLPEGMQRVGYDADTQTYTYQDADGTRWEGAEGARYGSIRRVQTYAAQTNTNQRRRLSTSSSSSSSSLNGTSYNNVDNNNNQKRLGWLFVTFRFLRRILTQPRLSQTVLKRINSRRISQTHARPSRRSTI